MNRRKFLQALFAVPVVAAPLLVPTVAQAPTWAGARPSDYYTSIPIQRSKLESGGTWRLYVSKVDHAAGAVTLDVQFWNGERWVSS
jgi:hypothetical protein